MAKAGAQRGSDLVAGEPSGPNYRVLAIYLLGIFMGALDTNVIGPAFPRLAHAFHVDLGVIAWTVTAYSVAYVVSTALAGGIGDRLGHRRIFLLGVTLFGVASVIAAWAPNLAIFLLARAVQGAGAGAVYPNAQAEGLGQFGAAKKGTALGMFGAVFGLASIIGPNVGGVLTQFLGWRTIFMVNIPLAAVVLILGGTRLPRSLRGATRGIPDAWGAIGFAAGLAAALIALSASGWYHLVFAAIAVLALAIFGWRQRRAAVPFLDAAPLANRAGAALMAGAALIGLDMASAVFVPALTQRELGLSVVASGVALMPAAFSGAVLAGAGGVMVDRMGARLVLLMGLLAAALGGVLLALPHLDWWRFIVAMICLGTGTAFTMGAPLNRMGIALYREEQAGEALGLMAVFRSVGLAAGPILLTLATAWHGFSGMYAEVALASLVGAGLFLLVPSGKLATVHEAASPGT